MEASQKIMDGMGASERLLVETAKGLGFKGIRNFWIFILGFVGFVDMGSTLLPYATKSFSKIDQDEDGQVLFLEASSVDGAETEFPPFILEFTKFLEKHSLRISCFFSFLMLVEGFYGAKIRRRHIVIDEEREYYNGGGKNKIDKGWWQTASFFYYQTIVFQLLLLPVGFYLTFLYDLQHISGIKEKGSILTEGSNATDVNIGDETYSETTKISLLFAVLKYTLWEVSGITQSAIKTKVGQLIRQLSPKAIKKVLFRAIRNPIKFRKTIRKLLTVVRWVKYLAPLIGATNKLKGNVQDMMKKYRQRRAAEKAQKARQILWEAKTVKLREEDAAIIIQSGYRQFITRKKTEALKKILMQKKHFAVLRVQRKFRSMLARARERLKKKKFEFARLKKARRVNPKKMDEEQKKRFYELERELHMESNNTRERKLLLRPNTKFAVYWKFLFVFCVIFEISNLMVKPWLDKHKKKRKDDPISISEFIAISFVPTRASQLADCGYEEVQKEGFISNAFARIRGKEEVEEEKHLPWYCMPPASTVQEAYSDLIALTLIPAPVSEWPDCQESKRSLWQKHNNEPKRWYCKEPYASTHTKYRYFIDFFQEQFLVFVGVVCFLDVFVTFFTGELDDTTGELIPKNFFTRWILPGLLLQLLVNPHVDLVIQITDDLWDEVIRLGPIRVLRWSLATVLPLVRSLWFIWITYIWIPMVLHENEFNIFALGMV